MSTDWIELYDLQGVAKAQADGWEIEFSDGSAWSPWMGQVWSSTYKFRGRPKQPKMKTVKLLAYLSEYELRWLKNKPAPHWIHIPSQDIEIEVPDDN